MRKWGSVLNGLLILVTLFGLNSNELIAQTIFTDRPTQTTSSALLSKGHFQVETGAFLSEAGDSFIGQDIQVQQWVFNNTLLRYGLTDRLELRFVQDLSQNRIKVNNVPFNTDVQAQPTLIGAKFQLLKNHDRLPDLALITQLGGNLFTNASFAFQTSLLLAVDQAINSEWAFSGNVGLNMTNDWINTSVVYTAMVTRVINTELSAFFEYYASLNEVNFNNHALDFGLMYLINDFLQIDAYGGFGLTDATPDLLLGFGLSHKILKD